MTRLTQTGKWEKYVWPLVAACVFLLSWHFLVKWSDTKVFPSPLSVERGMAELVHNGLLWQYILDSLRRVALGYLTAAVLAIPAGLLLGWYSSAGAVVDPVIQVIRPISPIAWIPVAIVWFGV
ncbi:MAG TPA: ABC transporter permease, partial [Candidatus Angelobacter sp.]